MAAMVALVDEEREAEVRQNSFCRKAGRYGGESSVLPPLRCSCCLLPMRLLRASDVTPAVWPHVAAGFPGQTVVVCCSSTRILLRDVVSMSRRDYRFHASIYAHAHADSSDGRLRLTSSPILTWRRVQLANPHDSRVRRKNGDDGAE